MANVAARFPQATSSEPVAARSDYEYKAGGDCDHGHGHDPNHPSPGAGSWAGETPRP